MKERKKTSVIWKIPKDEFQNLLDTSNSVVDVLIKLGFDGYNGNYKTVLKRIEKEEFCTIKLKENRRLAQSIHCKNAIAKKQSDKYVFCENSNYSRKNLKKRILENKILQYKCVECGNQGLHNNKLLVLQLDHKNGINNDNRIENLRFICPNCHTQTATYAGKRLKKEKIYETDEEKQNRILKCRKFNPTKEELQELVVKLPMTKVGKFFGVSDNAVRKRCKRLDIKF